MKNIYIYILGLAAALTVAGCGARQQTASSPPQAVSKMAAGQSEPDALQANKRKEIDDQIAKLKQYQEGSLTLSEFMEDGWKHRDFLQGKIGITMVAIERDVIVALDFSGKEESAFMLELADDTDKSIIDTIARTGVAPKRADEDMFDFMERVTANSLSFNIAGNDRFRCVLMFLDEDHKVGEPRNLDVVLTSMMPIGGCDFEWVKSDY